MNNQYFVALVLPAHLNKKILAYKTWMADNHGCKVSLKSPAHITLVPPFWTTAENEAALKTDLSAIASSFSSFALVTAGFSAFPPRTLFVAVNESENLLRLKEATENHFLAKPYGIKKESRPFHPHITIATRDLQKKAFAEGWAHFEKMKVEETFEATALSLLKHNGKSWDVIAEAAFSA